MSSSSLQSPALEGKGLGWAPNSLGSGLDCRFTRNPDPQGFIPRDLEVWVNMWGWLAGSCSLESGIVVPIFPTSTEVSDGEGEGLFLLPPPPFSLSFPSCSPAPLDLWALQLCDVWNRRVQLLIGLSSLSHFPSLFL